mmetsp:Transcript_35982/g.56284  ORF Transcript_35982/g.56284 Transcript_35982/m.56284 type:complete len:558 (+) Transcript_35982:159-1832(+)
MGDFASQKNFIHQKNPFFLQQDPMSSSLHLGLGSELVLSGTVGGSSGGLSTGSTTHQVVTVVSTRPLLVSEGLNTQSSLLTLDVLDVGEDTSGTSVFLGNVVDGQSVGVETTEGDKVPGESERSDVALEALDGGVVHTGSVPVERGGQVVGQHLVGASSVDNGSELTAFLNVGGGSLHPDEISNGAEVDGSHGAVVDTTADTVVTFTRAGGFPAPEDITEAELGGKSTSLLVGDLHGLLLPVSDEGVLASLLHGVSNGVGVAADTSSLEPLGLIGSILEDTDGLVDGTSNVRVVTGIDVVLDEGGGAGISTGNEHGLSTEDISLETGSDQTVDVLTNRDKDLASHVAALLGTRLLILNMDTSSTSKDLHLDQLHDRSHTTETGITISNDGAEEINLGGLKPLFLGHVGASLTLLAVMEELGLEELLNLTGNGVGGVVGEIGSRLLGGGGSGRALPTRDVDALEVLGHLGDLDGVKSTESMNVFAVVETFTAKVVHLLSSVRRSRRVGDGTTEANNILSRKRALSITITITRHPLLHFFNILLKLNIFLGNNFMRRHD